MMEPRLLILLCLLLVEVIPEETQKPSPSENEKSSLFSILQSLFQMDSVENELNDMETATTVENTINLEQDTMKEEQLEQDTMKEEQLEQDTMKEEQLEQDAMKEEQLEQDTMKKEQLEQDTMKKEQLEQDTMKEEQLEQDTMKEEQLEDMIKSENSEGDTTSTEIKNITVQTTKTKHVCIPYEGCTPQLNCTNFTNFNDSNLEGVINEGHAVGVNLTQLQYLLENITHINSCVIVMFYTTWCQYSIDFGPVLNKLGVVFSQMPVVAFDFGLYSPDQYLLAYVPRVILYYTGRVVYDVDTTMMIEDITDILSNMTGSTPNAIPTDEEMVNYDCPIPKELEDGNNVLWLAIISVVVIIGGNCILKSEFYEKCKQKFLHLKED